MPILLDPRNFLYLMEPFLPFIHLHPDENINLSVTTTRRNPIKCSPFALSVELSGYFAYAVV